MLEGHPVDLHDDMVVVETSGPAASEQGHQGVVAGGPEELEFRQLCTEEAVVDRHVAAPSVAVRDPRRDEDHEPAWTGSSLSPQTWNPLPLSTSAIS